MIKFEKKYFRRFNYKRRQIEKYLESAHKDLRIAKASEVPDVKFQFSYNTFIKLGICLIASHGYKVKSKSGHHVKIIEKTAEILNNNNISKHGNRMRKTRNTELYDGGGLLITKKQAGAYFDFVAKVFFRSKKFFKEYLGTLF